MQNKNSIILNLLLMLALAPVYAMDESGADDALQCAVVAGNLALVKEAVNKGAVPQTADLMHAILLSSFTNNIDIIKYFVEESNVPYTMEVARYNISPVSSWKSKLLEKYLERKLAERNPSSSWLPYCIMQ